MWTQQWRWGAGAPGLASPGRTVAMGTACEVEGEEGGAAGREPALGSGELAWVRPGGGGRDAGLRAWELEETGVRLGAGRQAAPDLDWGVAARPREFLKPSQHPQPRHHCLHHGHHAGRCPIARAGYQAPRGPSRSPSSPPWIPTRGKKHLFPVPLHCLELCVPVTAGSPASLRLFPNVLLSG